MLRRLALIPLILILLTLIYLTVGYFNFRKFHFIAHRGYGEIDNSIESFNNCTGFFGIECDVRITADNKFIVNHEPEIEYADGRKLVVAENNIADLTNKTLYNNEHVAKFSDYLAICAKLNKTALIELKEDMTDENLQALLSEIDEFYNRDNCVIISFFHSNLLKLKSMCNIELQLLFCDNKNENVQFCLNNKIGASMFFGLIDPVTTIKLHKNNLKVAAWTVDNFFVASHLAIITGGKLDYITSNLKLQ